jgi:hypothetical protein
MRLGINLGMEEPLGREILAMVSGLTIDVDRYNLPRDPAVLEPCVQSWVDTGIRPQLMFHRVEQCNESFVRDVTAMALEAYGDGGFDYEGPNEFRLAGVPIEDAIAATLLIERVGRSMGWTGTMLSTSVMNLDPSRDIPDLKTLAASLPAHIVLSVHRYCPRVDFFGQSQTRPWFGSDRVDETERVIEIAGQHPVAYTEFGPSRAPSKIWLGLRTQQLSFEDCRRYLVADLDVYAPYLERACVFQWGDGPDKQNHEHMRGIATDASGQWVLHPHASALTEWRATT